MLLGQFGNPVCDHSFIVVFQCARYTNWPKVCGQFSAFFVCVLDVLIFCHIAKAKVILEEKI